MNNTPIPTGTRDVLPEEAAEVRYLEASIRETFRSFGYGEVITPSLEKESVLETAGEERFKRSFRLFDERGEVLILRPEMTVPVARVVASRLADLDPPFRLSYFANSFRPTVPQRGRQSEFYQAGVECIGLDTHAADAEVLALLCRALENCGLKDFSVGLGESSFFRALLDNAGVRGKRREDVFASLVSRDMVRLGKVVEQLDISDDDREAIMKVTAMRGGSDVLRRAQDVASGQAMEDALKQLARTYYLVSRYGYARRILFDLGIFRNFEYYTGIVFEVYSEGLGFPVGGGGRYDSLLARFGRPLPAVGFAVGLDRLHIAVSDQGGVAKPSTPGLVLAGGLDPSLDIAMELRARGVTVFCLPAESGREQALAAAEANRLRFAALPEEGGTGFLLIDTAEGSEHKLEGESLIAELTE